MNHRILTKMVISQLTNHIVSTLSVEKGIDISHDPKRPTPTRSSTRVQSLTTRVIDLPRSPFA